MRQLDASAGKKPWLGPGPGCCGSVPRVLQMGWYPQHLPVVVQEGDSGLGLRLALHHHRAGVLGKRWQAGHASPA